MAIEIKYNNEVIYTITDTQLKIIKSYINEDYLDATIINRLTGQLDFRYSELATLFMNEWVARLQADPTVESVPVNTTAFVDMVIARPDYKTKKQQDTPVEEPAE